MDRLVAACGTDTYAVSAHGRRDAAGLLPEWRELLAANPARNPLCDPDLQMAWCEEFLAPGDERILAVRHTATGRLVGLIPLFVHRVVRGLRLGRSLHVFGALHEPLLHEVPEVVLDAGHARRALAAAVSWLYRKERWDWIDLDLRDDQPWPEPRWILEAGERSAIVNREPLLCVVLPLPEDGGFPPVGRNLRETLRRYRNRLSRRPGTWRVDDVRPGQPGWDAAVDDLVRLHAERAHLHRRLAHRDIFDGTAQERYLRGLPEDAAASPVITRLTQDGETRAVLLTLESPSVVAISASGFGADVWDLNAVSGLHAHAVQRAVDTGKRQVVFSPGMDRAKLRWSSRRAVTQRFSLVHPRRSSQLVFQLAAVVRRAYNLRVQLGHFDPADTGETSR